MTLCSELPDQLTADLDAEGDCWIWNGPNNGNGYGRIRWEGERWYLHRLMWELLVGPIPEGYQVDHLCRNRACVNPDHLEPVSQQENIARQVNRGRFSDVTRCKRGHPFSEENTYIDPKRGWRQCKACIRLRSPITNARRRERRRNAVQ